MDHVQMFKDVAKLIEKISADAHNETGSLALYARGLLTMIGANQPGCTGGADCSVHPWAGSVHSPDSPHIAKSIDPYPHRCTRTDSFGIDHAYEHELVVLDGDGYDGYERCLKLEGDPVHVRGALDEFVGHPKASVPAADSSEIADTIMAWLADSGQDAKVKEHLLHKLASDVLGQDLKEYARLMYPDDDTYERMNPRVAEVRALRARGYAAGIVERLIGGQFSWLSD